MKIRNKKRALFSSVLSLVLCITMLLGTTFAWFTSTAKSTGNRILSGGMGVELYKYDVAGTAYIDISDGSGDIFADEGDDAVFWEPGHTEIVFLQVKNAKSLALVYNLILDVALFRGADGRENLTLTNQANEEKVLTYAVLPDMTAEDFASGEYKEWEDILNASVSITGVVTAASQFTAVEERELKEKGACDSLMLAVHMDEDAGNEYQGCELSIDVDILARQMAHEYDSFSNQYDAEALFTESSYDALVGTGDMERANQAIWLYTGGVNKNRHGRIQFVKDDGSQDGSYYMKLTNSTDKCYYTGACTLELHKTTPIERQCVHLMYKNIYTYLEKNKEYTLNFWIKQSDIAHPTDVYLELPSKKKLSAKEEITKVLEEADTWYEISYKFKIEEDITSSCKFAIWTDANADADSTVCIDNIRLYTEEGQVAKDESAFKAMLAAEKEVSMLPDKSHDPFEAVAPVSGTPDNYLTNGTFDTGVEGWVGNPDTTASMYSWVEGDSTSDGGYFIIDNEETKKSPAVKQNVYNIIGGAEYQIKFDYKIDPENTSTVPEIKIECFNTPVDDGDTGYLEGVALEWDPSLFINDGEWHTFSYRARVVERTEWVEVFLRHTKNTAYATTESAVYYDNVSFTMTDTPDVMSLNPMKIFYSDMESTDFIATLEFLKDEYEDGVILFEVYDGQDKVFESNRIPLQNYTAQTSFDLGLMTKKGSPYALVVSLYVNGEVKSQIGQNIFVYDRPAALDEDGNYVKFGKDFIPVLGLHIFEEAIEEGQEDVFENLSEAGITVIGIRTGHCKTPEKALETLDRLEKYGLKGIVSLYMQNKPAGHEDNMLNTIKIVSDPRVRNHPALFGYNIQDEPYLQDNDAASVREDLENSYRLIRQYDTDNVITFVENLEEYIGLSSAFTDGIILDVYCSADDLRVYHDLTVARDVVVEGRGYWSVLATYVTRFGEFNTPDDVRNNNYQAFLAGAAGIGYFSISDSGNLYGKKLSTEEPYVSAGWADHVWETSKGYIPLWKVTTPWSDTAGLDVWNTLKSFKEKEQPILAKHFVAKDGKKLIEDINIDGGYMYYSWAAEDGKIYLAVLDVKGEDVNVNISLKNADEQPIGNYTATLIAGRDGFGPVTGTDALNLALTGVEALLFEITEN